LSAVGDADPSGDPPQRFRMLVYWIVLGVIVAIFVLLPLSIVISNEITTATHGCVAGRACMIDGRNWEYDLEGDMLLLGFGVPVAAVLGVVWLIVLLIHRSIWRRKFR
jgi:hypothetical protein